ncbi:hypothetical protein Bhyg_02693, partial [Pseudolycoriella hygida]
MEIKTIFLIAVTAVLCLLDGIKADSVVEDGAYYALKQILMADGKSEGSSDCIVRVLKLTGVSSVVTDIRNIANPSQMINKLEDKANIAFF